jgi:hypothetical protein
MRLGLVCDVIDGLHHAPTWHQPVFLIGSQPSVKCGLTMVELKLKCCYFRTWLVAAAPALAKK